MVLIHNGGKDNSSHYLACEHYHIFAMLMLSAGMMGAYTYNVRGGVFCNAQTANFVMMSIAFGQANWKHGLYYLIPITAYLLGAYISEAVPTPIKKVGLLRWDTWLVALEALALFLIGFVPLSVPHQFVQVAVNFLASMQYNTFRQAEGITMSTTFCSNHTRQVGIALAKLVRKHDMAAFRRGLEHLGMILSFCAGGLSLTIACRFFPEKSIWLCLIPLTLILIELVHADLTSEHDLLSQKPSGH